MSTENLVLLVIAFALAVAHAAVSGPLAHALAAKFAKLGLRGASPGSARGRFVAAGIVVASVLVALVALERAHARAVACDTHAAPSAHGSPAPRC